MTVQSPTLAERIAARALVRRADELGQQVEPGILDKAREIVRNAAEQDAETMRARKPIRSPE
jgi:hypothetical protein